MDPNNVGDWYCSPFRYFPFGDYATADIVNKPAMEGGDFVILGGGGLISKNFGTHIERLARFRERLGGLIAWGIGESLNNEGLGRLAGPWTGPLPDYLAAFDLVGIRDFGTQYRWVPCASCFLDHFDRDYAIEHEFCVYEHRRIPVPIECGIRRSNLGSDIDATIAFLGAAKTVITNSYHGAYWATLLGRRVIAIPNMSKMYRFRHPPIVCSPSEWRERAEETNVYSTALAECREANQRFYSDVGSLIRYGRQT